METPVQSTRTGFTLIELSIVLVVIGLIVGGIMVGRDLIKAAEVRQTISQQEAFGSAANAFKTKYNCLPGDCAAASQYGLTTGVGWGNGNGNGDGMLGTLNGTPSDDEYKLFWLHLYNAGLLKSTQPPGPLFYGAGPTVAGYHSPTCPFYRRYAYTYFGTTVQAGGWFAQQLQNYPTLNCGAAPYGSWTSHGGQIPSWNAFVITGLKGVTGGNDPAQINAVEAYAIDSKIDDGLPFTGTVVAFATYTYSDAACSGDINYPALRISCNVGGWSGTNQYLTTDSTPCGNLIIRAGF